MELVLPNPKQALRNQLRREWFSLWNDTHRRHCLNCAKGIREAKQCSFFQSVNLAFKLLREDSDA